MPNKKLNNRRISIQDVDGKRINIYLPVGTTKAAKEIFKAFAKKLIKHEQGNLELSDKDIKYLETLSTVYKEKLKKLGIKFKEENPEEYQLSNLVNVFNKAKDKTDDSEDNKGKYNLTGQRLIKKFGATKDIRDLTQEDGFDFWDYLVTECNQRRDGTARRINGYAHTIFNSAVKKKLIDISPFDEVPKNSKPNHERHFEITPEITQKIWKYITNDEDKLRFVIMRFLGLRCPSELNLLQWNHFNFHDGMVKIHAPKNKKNSKYIRWMPFTHPNVLPVVKRAFEKRNRGGDESIVTPLDQTNLSYRVRRWIGAAGLEVWPNLLSNFRKTAVTEASRVLPSHVVCAYFGHSEKVSKENYRMVTEVDAANFSSLPFILKMEDAA
ncbi:site-specific integrase [Pirellulales bacterium]|nr:site-specific integrase [Pirellulales bacterium]